MSKIKAGWLGLLMAFTGIAITTVPQEAQAQPMMDVSFQTFYDQLSPYGTWYNDPQYGYVWVPNAGSDFRPYYTNGYWANTNYGNMWMSNYAWGWAPFHYGRWTYNNMYGWVWIPGNEWGPAWVSWRQGGGYYGWAPLGPGISISISFGSGYYTPYNYWTFIPYRHLYARSYGSYYRPGRTQNIYNNTTIINNVYNNTYITGPKGDDYTRQTGQRVPTYNIQNSNTVGRSRVQGNNIAVYRPDVNQNKINGRTPSPKTVKTVSTPIVTTPKAPVGQPRVTNQNTIGTQRNMTGTTNNVNDRLNVAPSQNRTNNVKTVSPATNNRVAAPQNNVNVNRNTNSGTINNNRTTAPQQKINRDNTTPSVNRDNSKTMPVRSNTLNRPTSFQPNVPQSSVRNSGIGATQLRSSAPSKRVTNANNFYNSSRNTGRASTPSPISTQAVRSTPSFQRKAPSFKSNSSSAQNRSVKDYSSSRNSSKTRFER